MAPRPADPNAKAALVAAARAEFARRGLKGARIEDITAACGLSKGAFYLHFPSKEKLFGELVEAFVSGLVGGSDRRVQVMADFLGAHGPITQRDVEERTERYERLFALETAEDLAMLELMWTYRDVLGVLVRGCYGTAFEGTFWELADTEVLRVAEKFGTFQGDRVCRRDIPPELFGSLVVGTYLILGQRMTRATEKPDLASWARSLHRLIREGSAPQGDREGPPQPPRSSPPPRSQS